MEFYDPIAYTITIKKWKQQILISFTGLMDEGEYDFIDRLIDDLNRALSHGPGTFILVFDLDNTHSVGDAMWAMGAKLLNWYMRSGSLSAEKTRGHIFAFSNNQEIRDKWRVVMKHLVPVYENLEEVENRIGGENHDAQKLD